MSSTLKPITFYVIRCRDPEITDCYVGRTGDFKQRVRQHKRDCNNPKSKRHNLRLYQFIREHGGWDNWYSEGLETRECMPWLIPLVERDWYEECGATLNTDTPGQTGLEYRKLHRNEAIARSNSHYQANRVEINVKRREKVECECGTVVTKGGLVRHRKTKKHARLMAEKSA